MRIRTLKPEWLEDEKLAAASDAARVLSAGLILMADDYGRARASLATIAATVWRYQLERDGGQHAPEVLRRASGAFQECVAMGFVVLYEVNGQSYYAIRNWEHHQKVSHRGKPLVPPPPEKEIACDIANNGEPLADLQTSSGESPESLRPDPDHDQRPRPRPEEPAIVVEVEPERPATGVATVDELLAMPATSRIAWRLLDALSQLHVDERGREIVSPGIMPSAKDLDRLETVLERARRLSGGPGDRETLSVVACEWTALLSLVAARECDPPRGPAVAYFASRFGRLEADRVAAGAEPVPARSAA